MDVNWWERGGGGVLQEELVWVASHLSVSAVNS